MGFESSDPSFSVRDDGSIYARRELSGLSEPIQFLVTARDAPNAQAWETTVKLALAGPPSSPAPTLSQVREKVWFFCGATEASWNTHTTSHINIDLAILTLSFFLSCHILTLPLPHTFLIYIFFFVFLSFLQFCSDIYLTV